VGFCETTDCIHELQSTNQKLVVKIVFSALFKNAQVDRSEDPADLEEESAASVSSDRSPDFYRTEGMFLILRYSDVNKRFQKPALKSGTIRLQPPDVPVIRLLL
jgi:hypothetical protein